MKTQLAIQKFLDNRRAQNLKPKSIAWYEAELKKFAGAYPELPTEPEPVEEFLTNIEGVSYAGLSSTTEARASYS